MLMYSVFLTYDCVQSIFSNTKGYKLGGLKVNFETNLFCIDVAIIYRVHDVKTRIHRLLDVFLSNKDLACMCSACSK